MPLAVKPRLSLGPVEGLLAIRPGGPSLSGYDVARDGSRVLTFKPVEPRSGEGRRLVLVER